MGHVSSVRFTPAHQHIMQLTDFLCCFVQTTRRPNRTDLAAEDSRLAASQTTQPDLPGQRHDSIHPTSLSLLKLTNITEVAQQSKARGKDDFLIAFSPVSHFCTPAQRHNLTSIRSSQKLPQPHTKETPLIFSRRFAGLSRCGELAMSSKLQSWKLWRLV